MCVYVCGYVYIHTYIHACRQRERERMCIFHEAEELLLPLEMCKLEAMNIEQRK